MDTLSICNGLSQIFTRRLFLYFYILYFYFDDKCLENVRHYRYLGVYFSASGNVNYGQDDIFKKASFKLTKLITSGEPSIKNSLHFYEHLILPIVLYGSEIWGILHGPPMLVNKTNFG